MSRQPCPQVASLLVDQFRRKDDDHFTAFRHGNALVSSDGQSYNLVCHLCVLLSCDEQRRS